MAKTSVRMHKSHSKGWQTCALATARALSIVCLMLRKTAELMRHTCVLFCHLSKETTKSLLQFIISTIIKPPFMQKLLFLSHVRSHHTRRGREAEWHGRKKERSYWIRMSMSFRYEPNHLTTSCWMCILCFFGLCIIHFCMGCNFVWKDTDGEA